MVGQVSERDVKSTAKSLAREARRRAEGTNLPTPWAAELEQNASNATGRARSGAKVAPTGGKMDDITVLVAYVEEA
eukprot:1204271-Pyramimonas_sp.AAC.2